MVVYERWKYWEVTGKREYDMKGVCDELGAENVLDIQQECTQNPPFFKK